MAKKKSVRKPDDLSLAQLRQMVDDKASELSELRSQRAALRKELHELDRSIQETEGVGRKKTAGGGMAKSPAQKKKKVTRKKKITRAKNALSAKGHAKEILTKESQGLTLNDLSEQILAAGYKTKSVNFKNTLYQSLYNDRVKGKNFNFNDKTGLWTLK